MKILAAIMGCRLHENNGYHDAIRDTWGKDAKDSGWDLRFFVGRGDGYLKADQVFLDVPDNKETLLYKVSGICSWALENGYDMVLKANTNSYVDVAQVRNAFNSRAYQDYDYIGSVVGNLGGLYGDTEIYGFVQGSTSWLSSKAARIVADEAVPYALKMIPKFVKYSGVTSPYLHSEDLWIGQVLTPRFGEIKSLVEPGYSNGPLSYWSQSGYIKLYCLREWMEALHSVKHNSDRMVEVNLEYRRKGA